MIAGAYAFLLATLLSAAPDASAQQSACTEPGYIVALNSDPIAVPPKKGHPLMQGTAIRVYEGQGWSKFSVTQWNCLEDARAALPQRAPDPKTGLPPYALFGENAGFRNPKADRVPNGCNQEAYVMGMYRVTNPEQYGKYAKALGASNLGGAFGMRIPFGGDHPLAVSGGTWPANTTLNFTLWPSIEAFEGFFLGDEYQKNILPLRKDAAFYNLARFQPVPAK